jgi:ribosomal protein S18 acetylase RimI-like enzyme
VACIGNEVCGIGACFGSESRFTFSDGRLIFKFYGPRYAAGVIKRGLKTGTVMPPPMEWEWMIAHLAVSNTRQGHGIGRQLVRQFVQHGQREHKKAAVLDVSVENPRAQALYERLGFVVTGEQVSILSSDHGRVPNHRRMQHDLV